MQMLRTRSFKSLLAFLSVIAASLTVPEKSYAATECVGYAESCVNVCDPDGESFCHAFGCMTASCSHSYSCGFFRSKVVCHGNIA